MKNSKGILTGFAATLWMFMGMDVMGQGSLTPPDAPGETMEGRADSSDPIAVQFTTPTSGVVSVAVYGEDDVQLRELVIGQRLEAGKHQVWWDGRVQPGAPSSFMCGSGAWPSLEKSMAGGCAPFFSLSKGDRRA